MSEAADLLTRLRRIDTRTEDAVREAWGAMLEAADEIDRLRKDCAELRDALSSIGEWVSNGEQISKAWDGYEGKGAWSRLLSLGASHD